MASEHTPNRISGVPIFKKSSRATARVLIFYYHDPKGPSEAPNPFILPRAPRSHAYIIRRPRNIYRLISSYNKLYVQTNTDYTRVVHLHTYIHTHTCNESEVAPKKDKSGQKVTSGIHIYIHTQNEAPNAAKQRTHRNP